MYEPVKRRLKFRQFRNKRMEVSMGDMRESFDYMKELNKERKERNLASASREGWHLHTEYHWSRQLQGKRLDYWPSKNKFQYDGKVMCGDVLEFIRKRETE